MSLLGDKKILITGGLGFIGSNLAIELVEQGADVEIYDALLSGLGGNLFNIEPIKKKVKVTIAKLEDSRLISKAVKNKDYIFNLAGTLSHIDSMVDPFTDLEINCRAQLCLLEACRKFNGDVKIIFAGTRNQYGKALYLPVDEKHIQEPIDINGINSIAAEKYHLLYDRIWGIRAVSLRMTNTFGPRHQMKHSKQGVLNWFIRLLMEGKTVELFGDGSQIRDVNYVDDVVDALLLCAKSKRANGQVYNLGGNPITLREFVEKAVEIYGSGKYRLVGFPKERREIEVGNYVADIGKIREELSWQPKISIDEGIKRTLEFYNQFKKYYF